MLPLTARMAMKEPSKVARQKMAASIMKRRTASSRTLCHAPFKVSRALPADAQDGTSRTTENAMPSVCTQWGRAV